MSAATKGKKKGRKQLSLTIVAMQTSKTTRATLQKKKETEEKKEAKNEEGKEEENGEAKEKTY